MRLTERSGTYYLTSGANIIETPDLIEGHKFTGEAVVKLGQLEDAEEKLKTNFLILAKAKMDGIYRRMSDGIEFYPRYMLNVYIDYILVLSGAQLFLFEYGTTWALTKEELE